MIQEIFNCIWTNKRQSVIICRKSSFQTSFFFEQNPVKLSKRIKCRLFSRMPGKFAKFSSNSIISHILAFRYCYAPQDEKKKWVENRLHRIFLSSLDFPDKKEESKNFILFDAAIKRVIIIIAIHANIWDSAFISAHVRTEGNCISQLVKRGERERNEITFKKDTSGKRE